MRKAGARGNAPIIFGLLVCFFGAVWPVAATTISIEPASAVMQVGQSVLVNVSAASVNDLYAFQFDLSFDPALVAATLVQQGDLLSGSGGFFPGFIDNIAGSVTIVGDTLTGLIPGISGNGTLAAISFTALALGTTTLSLANIILLDSGLADITATSQDGALIVQGTTTVPEPVPLLLVTTGLLVACGWRRAVRARGGSDRRGELMTSE